VSKKEGSFLCGAFIFHGFFFLYVPYKIIFI